MACSLAAILRPISGGSTADTQLQNELTGRGRQVNGAHGLSLSQRPWVLRKHLTPRPFAYPARDDLTDSRHLQMLRSTALIIQDRDGSLLKEPRKPRHNQLALTSYQVEFPAELLDEQNSLIDRIISFAFDTLGAQRLDVRVREAE